MIRFALGRAELNGFHLAAQKPHDVPPVEWRTKKPPSAEGQQRFDELSRESVF